MSRSTAVIQPTVLAVYVDNLKKLSDSKLSATLERVQEVVPDETISIRELPTAVPEIVRRVLAANSKRLVALMDEIEETLAILEEAAEQEYDRREEVAQAALPHCEKCGQVLTKKARPRGR